MRETPFRQAPAGRVLEELEYYPTVSHRLLEALQLRILAAT